MPFNFNLLQSIQLLKKSWDKVTPETIENCYQNVHFLPNDGCQESEDETVNDEFQDILDQMSGPSVDEYVTFDDDVETAGLLSEQEIIEQLQERPEIESEEGTTSDVQTIPPPESDVTKAVNVLKQYLSTIESSDSIMSSFYEVEHCIEREVFLKKKRQTSLLDYI